MGRKRRILVAPLNWGLGHATRCIPIIRMLEERNCEVIIGAEGNVLQLLRYEFPQLSFVEFPGLKIKYPRNGALLLHFALRLPSLLRAVKKEQQFVRKLVRTHQIDGIISDNRYGAFHKEKPSVLLTHQLFIESPIFKKSLERIVHQMVQKFDECWVPDVVGTQNLSGDLSHKKGVSPKVKFIGLLSRFWAEKQNETAKRKLLVVLSGPEPQRSILEEKLIEQLHTLDCNSLLVSGLVQNTQEEQKLSEKITQVNYLTSEQLRQALQESELIVCRSGYSSLMDLVTLGKKALLIPTPGQTEQEYLASYLNGNGFVGVSQEEVELSRDIDRLEKIEPPSFNLAEVSPQWMDQFLLKC